MTKKGGYQAKERKHFNRLAQTTGQIWWGSTTRAGVKRLRRRARLAAQEIARWKNPMVLELGCGVGAFTNFVLEEIPLLRLIGCDISFNCVRIANERYGVHKNVYFGVADVTALPYATNTFDAVIGNSILHHLPLEVSLQEIFRIVKPGGIIWFSEPNMMNPQVAIEKNIPLIGRMLQNTENETAFFRWSIAKILRKIGFQSILVQPFDFLHPIVPNPLVGISDKLGQVAERIPLLREISGSLLIRANKPI